MFDVIQNRRVLFGAGAIDRLGALLAAEPLFREALSLLTGLG